MPRLRRKCREHYDINPVVVATMLAKARAVGIIETKRRGSYQPVLFIRPGLEGWREWHKPLI